MSCNEDSIEILAKGRGQEAIVSLRQNELIQNLRALVAVRFEVAIPQVVLVFGGVVLRDEGTIDTCGIISGVTVHVVFRPDLASPAASVSSSFQLKPLTDPLRTRSAATIAGLLGHPRLLRMLFQEDPRLRSMIESNAMLRHYLNSDRNLREIISQVFGPARQEVERRRDLNHLRLEMVPGGYRLLSRLNYFISQAYEHKVAKTYLRASRNSGRGPNPQRGLENNMPLPNPWIRKANASSWDNLDAETRLRCETMMRAMQALQLLQEGEVTMGQEKATQTSSSVGQEMATQTSPTVGQLKVTKPSLAPPLQRDGRDVYQAQLDQLVQMGYMDPQRNLCALRISLGNVDSAVRLLDHWNRSGE